MDSDGIGNGEAWERGQPARPDAGEPPALPEQYRYVANATPKQLAHDFFAMVLSQVQRDAEYDFAPLLAEEDAAATHLRDHLRRHLLDRTLVHLGEQLKSEEYTASWRAFNRLLLEGLRDGVEQLKSGQETIQQSQETIQQMQQETLNRLDALLSQPPDSPALGEWNNHLADLLQATGRIEARQQTSFVVLLRRTESQHTEVMEKLSEVEGTLANLPDVQGALEHLLERLADARAIPDPYNVQGLPNPYLGLQPFTYAERERYAGREAQIQLAIEKLTTPGQQRVLLFVTGASGSGKSSFAQAGLLPALQQHYQQRHRTTRPPAVFRPSKYPLAMLADALLQLGLPALAEQPTPSTLSTHIQQHTPAQSVNLLVIDQFEEVFTQAEPAQRDTLFAWLVALPPFSDLRTHIIATVRSDYLPELFAYRDLYACVKEGMDLRAMTVAELTQAIQQPLQSMYPDTGKSFEPHLLQALATDAATDATYLPLLQVTLEDLWAKGTLKRHAYGSMTDAIRQRAEQVYARRLDDTLRTPAEQQALLQTFLDLVEVSLDDDARRDVRRRRTIAELTRERPAWEKTIDELATARLLSKGLEQQAEREVEVVDIIHETLISRWDRLRDAIAEQRTALQQRVRFELALAEWQTHNRADAYLLAGMRLTEAQMLDERGDVALSQENEAARELLKRSVAKRDRRRRIVAGMSIAAMVVFALLAVAAGLFGVQAQQNASMAQAEANQRATAEAGTESQWRRRANQRATVQAQQATEIVLRQTAEAEAEAKQREAEAQAQIARSRQLAAQSGSWQERNLAFALLLAIESDGITRTVESQQALLNGLLFSPHINASLRGHTAAVLSVAFSPDGQTLASASSDDTLILWDVATRQPRGEPLRGHTADVKERGVQPGWADAGLRQLGTPSSCGTSPRASRAASRCAATRPPSGAWRSARMGRRWPPPVGTTPSSCGTSPRASRAASRCAATRTPSMSVAFSPDGQTLASASDDDTLILWDVATRQPRGEPLRGHTSRRQ